MIFIKRFSESIESIESIGDIIYNIKDICLDITDGRFSFSILGKCDTIVISLSDVRDYDGFTLSEVEEVIQRIYDYLTIRRYMGCSALKVGEINRTAIRYIENDDRLSNIAIHFKV